MFKRYSTAVLSAFVITFFLFAGMNRLITADQVGLPETKHHGPIIVGQVEDITPPRDKIRKPDRPDQEDVFTNTPKPDTLKPTRPGNPGPGFIGPKPTVPQPTHSLGLPEGDLQPITKFAPAYPRGPQTKGIEGYVVVKFTVSKTGAVKNATIVESTHRAFEKVSLRAVSKYKYKPRVINGEAIEVHDVMEKIKFELDSS